MFLKRSSVFSNLFCYSENILISFIKNNLFLEAKFFHLSNYSQELKNEPCYQDLRLYD